MATILRWLGHGTWHISTGKYNLVVDPFVDENPLSPVRADELECQFILITHGHYDHMADAERIACRTGATIISVYEICHWFERKGISAVHSMNIGGSYNFPFGRVKMVPAWHSSMLPDGSCGGQAAGFVLFLPEGNIYIAGDTGLFGDMKLIGDLNLEVAILPIGDNFTMGPEDALLAVKLLRPRRVVPMHTGTWPLIEQDPHQWAERVRKESATEVTVLRPGEMLTLGNR
ncbi:MAG: metal-dependent hydrolase [Thermoguttaceae bacterium]|nr:metal-dependent hydrolase [Thermoguttaceae bacterium]MDW8078539.1 metal-dependent hydrolase [Thermoguttaceae bacterium]